MHSKTDPVDWLIFIVILILTGALGFAIGYKTRKSMERTDFNLPACKYEDSTNCRWNARTRGNGTGASFTSIRVNKLDWIIYDNGCLVIYNGVREIGTYGLPQCKRG